MTVPAPGGGAAAVVNENATSDAIAAGGIPSVSETWSAVTVTVQVVP